MLHWGRQGPVTSPMPLQTKTPLLGYTLYIICTFFACQYNPTYSCWVCGPAEKMGCPWGPPGTPPCLVPSPQPLPVKRLEKPPCPLYTPLAKASLQPPFSTVGPRLPPSLSSAAIPRSVTLLPPWVRPSVCLLPLLPQSCPPSTTQSRREPESAGAFEGDFQ